MADQLTTRWIRLKRAAAQAIEQVGLETVTPFSDGKENAKPKKDDKQLDVANESTLSALVYGAWQAFFNNFREDEQTFELPHYQAAAIVVTDRLAQLGETHGLDAHTVHLMLELLRQFNDARFRDVDERISDLMASCQQLRAQLDVSELSKCYQEDELNSCQRLVRSELKRLGIESDNSEEIYRPSHELRILLSALGREATTRTSATQTPPNVPVLPAATALKNVDINQRDSLDWTQLHSAAFVGKLELVSLLLEKGADVNAKAKDGTLPLHLAAKRGHVSVAKLLFTKGANLSAKDADGNTPVHLASELYTTEMLTALIGMGAMVNQRNTSGWTPLHLAANKGKIEVIECLISAGADINSTASNGWTALAVAANCGHLQLTAKLRELGGRQ
jgi:hypothetical protein